MFQTQRKPYLAGFFGVSNGRGKLNWPPIVLITIFKFIFLFSLEYQLECPTSISMLWHVACNRFYGLASHR